MAKDINSIFFDITPEIEELALKCETNNAIDKELYTKYEVKRGLRDLNGKGVLAGLTNISDVCATKIVDGVSVPCAGNLYYRGYNIKDLVSGFLEAKHFGFEEIAYLLLFGELPNQKELENFKDMIADRRMLPPNFVRDVIMKAPSRDMMNSITRSILQLYSYDDKADDTSIPNVLRQSLNLISQFPMLMVYSYLAYNYRMGEDLYIYAPKKELSMAENILMMLREDRQYTELEAKILDMALVLHMDHGGGNNSTFTTHVVTSSGTDTYSTIAAAMASLKGPKHGGANVKVTQMFEDMKTQLTDWQDDDQIRAYLEALLEKRAFDKRGLIYGMGHAIYSVSDPRAEIFKKFVKQLAYEKGHEAEYVLYEKVEKMAPEIISERRKMYKGVNANVDFYSGLVYSMLDLPPALYTPIFAAARIVGWSAHRIEELVNADKIIRPLIKAQKAGMDVNANQLESHLLSGGRVDNVVDALIAAHRANLDLSFERAAAIDLAGRNVFEAVKMSVTPKIIETPWISAVAIDGIEVKVIAKVTVRANLSRLVGGAGEETIIARVGEGIVTTVGSSQSHKSVLENPDLISRTVLSKGLDNGTAFEILSIDIADVDIGRNIGAHLQIQQAEADKQIAQAKAEERRATAIAKEQEMRAEVEHMKAKVVEAEAEVPRAMAEALRSGNLGVMDYYRMQNVQADTAMKNNVGNTDLSKVFHKEQCIETKDN